MTEDVLLNELLKGERRAYKQVYTDSYLMIRTFIMRNKGTDADAQDIFQEGLITLIENIRQDDFKLSSKVSTYLYSIVRYKWLYKLRGSKEIVSINDTHKELVDEGDLILEKEVFEQKHTLVSKLIKTIGADCQTLLLGFYIEKKSMVELATALGYTKAFVKIKKGRCLNSLRKKILSHPDYLSLNMQ